jgi:FixJ family two-component response regulator
MATHTTFTDTHFEAAAAADTPVVFVVDDDESTRASLAVLAAASGWRVEAFASAQELLARPRAVAPSCLVLDITPSGAAGLDLQQRLTLERPELPVIVVSARADVALSVRAMKAGAIEFLVKPLAEAVLLDAIHNGLQRSRRIVEREVRMAPLRESYASLTPREREVMTLVVSGLLNKQVGSELGISEITVKAHRGRVMQKMKADSLPMLVTMVARLGLTSTWAR